jgi:hypothetical protein
MLPRGDTIYYTRHTACKLDHSRLHLNDYEKRVPSVSEGGAADVAVWFNKTLRR